MPKLFHDMEPGQTVQVSNVKITLERKSGRKARLAIEEMTQLQPSDGSGKVPPASKGKSPWKMPAQ